MKRLLLDTHAVIWWLASDRRLGAKALDAIEDSSNEVLVSSVSGFEVATKRKLGKLDVPDDFSEQIQASGFAELPVTLRHGLEAGQLPLHHKDPFDRLLIGQARCEDLIIVTSDRILSEYDVELLPAS